MQPFDPRTAPHIDFLTDLAYARLLSSACARGLGIYVMPSDGLKPATLEALRRANDAVLAELLDRAGVLVPATGSVLQIRGDDGEFTTIAAVSSISKTDRGHGYRNRDCETRGCTLGHHHPGPCND